MQSYISVELVWALVAFFVQDIYEQVVNEVGSDIDKGLVNRKTVQVQPTEETLVLTLNHVSTFFKLKK